MSRSKWKGNFISKAVLKNKPEKKQYWSRQSTIPAFLVGKTISIYNGKEFKKVKITKERVGFKMGEFSLTRKYTAKTKKLKK